MSFETLFDWSEAWAPLIPIAVALKNRRQPDYVRPVVLYFWISLFLNIVADIIWKRKTLGIDFPFTNNNPLYNLNSIARLILFSIFFNRLRQPFLKKLKSLMPLLFLAFMVADLLLWEPFFDTRIANILHAVEAGILLFFCFQFYFYLLRTEAVQITKLPSFWIVTGLFIYVGVCLPIYIYYDDLLISYKNFAIDIWSVPKIGFLILCLASAIGLSNKENQKTLSDE